MTTNKKSNDNLRSKAPHTLSYKLVAATLLSSILIALCVSGIQIYSSYKSSIKEATNRFELIEQSYLPSLSTSLWEISESRTNALLDGIAQLPTIGKIILVNETHDTFIRNENAEDGFSGKDFQLIYTENGESFPVGKLHIELTKTEILNQLKARAISIAITSIFTLLLGSMFVLVLFQRWVTRHLLTMASFAKALDLENIDTPLTLNRPPQKDDDELELVVKAINQMQHNLKEGLATRLTIEAELRHHQENLEKIVAERTLDLEVKSQLLQEKTAELEIQNRELDAYAHSVAHDLKNPLTTIIGMSSILKASKTAPEAVDEKSPQSVIHRTALKMNAIIDALLLLANIRRKDEIKIESLNIHQIAIEACSRLQDFAVQHQASIEFVGDWQNACGQSQWIEEVWVNYLSNAIKYGGNPPRIEIGAEQLDDSTMKFWVADFGTGIATNRQSELFVQFSRLEATGANGHGLGLSIVKRIIHRLQGDVGYEKASNDTNRFWFTLPR